MRGLASIGATGTLLLVLLSSAAQEKPKVVNLKIIHNGRERPLPDHVKLSLDRRSLEIPVRDGKFEMPSEFAAARRVTFEADVGNSHIRLTRISRTDLREENWTLRLAEHANEDYYNWPGPKTASISESCIVDFRSPGEEPEREYFEEHCRSDRKSRDKPVGLQQARAPLPKIISASVPFYPQLAPQTRIEGIVKLRISTDGKRVSAVEAETGPPMLVQSAKENVNTWQFEPHTPTSFEVTFQYKLLLPQCDSEYHGDSVDKESVLLQLPTNVALSAKIPPICDPAVDVGKKTTAAEEKPVDTEELLPKAVTAFAPFYPELARRTGIQGVVTLGVSTDGKNVSSFDARSGHPLLVQAAEESVKTWRFEPHSPTTFDVTFRYRRLPVTCDSQCNCDSEERESVLLQLPTNVEVSAKQVMLCDPAVVIGHKK